MADDQATFAERFTGEPPPDVLKPGTEGETFANPQYAKRYAAQQFKQGNYLRGIAAGLESTIASAPSAIMSWFSQSQKAYQTGLTPAEEIEFGVNASLSQIGGAEEFKLPKTSRGAFEQFHEQVSKPLAQNLSIPDVEPPKRISIPLDVRNVNVGNWPSAAATRSELAQTGEPHVDAILNSPVTKDAIDNARVDRTHDVPYTAGGSVPLQDPTMFIDKNFPRSFNIDGVVFDPADPFIIHENVEQHVMDVLTQGGMDDAAAYKVAHFEFAEKAEGAWYNAHGIDQAKAEAAYAPYMAAIQHGPGADFPPNLYDRPYPHDQPSAAKGEAITEPRPTPAEIDRAKQIIEDWQAKGSPSPEPQAPQTANPLVQARELGVVGPDRPDILTPAPREAAARATQDVLRGPEPGQPSAWRQRWERTLDKMQTPDDARKVISAIVDANDEFVQARQGDLSPGQIEQLGLVTGLDSTKIDVSNTSAKIKTNVEIRNTIEAFRSINDKIAQAAREVADKRGVADQAELERLVQVELQRDLLLKATISSKEFAALRAEFGRIGNVIQEYMAAVKETNGLKDFLKDTAGETVDDVRDRARIIADTPPDALPKVIQSTRKQIPQGWAFWMWQQGLISGPWTHAKYLAVNTATTALERTIAPEVAAIIGKARGENVSLVAPLYANVGMVRALPEAFKGAAAAYKSGLRVPLQSEMELELRGVENPQAMAAKSAYTTPQPLEWGFWKNVFNEDQLASAAKVLGIPGRAANFIHTFYKIINERGALASRAYEQAFEDGATGDAFWNRVDQYITNPTDEMLRGAVTDAYRGAFMAKLPKKTGEWARFASTNPYLKWAFPFQHIPWNIERMTIEYSPLAVFGTEMRAALMGQKGAAVQNLAWAKVAVGTSVITYFMNKALNGQATGDYPTDNKERQRWRMLNLQPNSVRMGDEWVSMERFGPPGNIAKLGANLGDIVHHYNGQNDDALTKAIWAAGKAAVNQIADETGFQTMRNLIDAFEDDHKASRFIAYQGSTFMPFSSFVRQNASALDPDMRQANSLVSGLKYSIPYLRETLPPKRDALYGEPMPNPGYATPFRAVPVTTDRVKTELDRIGYYPAAPRNTIGGVKLTPEQYDRYEATAGPLVKQALSGLIHSPQWQANAGNPEWQKTVAKEFISGARRQAAAAMQLESAGKPGDLIEAGRQRRLHQINGAQ